MIEILIRRFGRNSPGTNQFMAQKAKTRSHVRTRLSAAQIVKVRELLDEGWTHREIADEVGVSRCTVATYDPQSNSYAEKSSRDPHSDMTFTPIPPTWCPHCRTHIVLSPCVECYIRAQREARQAKTSA